MKRYAPIRPLIPPSSSIHVWKRSRLYEVIASLIEGGPYIDYYDRSNIEPEGSRREFMDRCADVAQMHRATFLENFGVRRGYTTVSRLQYEDDAVWFEIDYTDLAKRAYDEMNTGLVWDVEELCAEVPPSIAYWTKRVNSMTRLDQNLIDEINSITHPELKVIHDLAFAQKLKVWTPA